MNTLKPGYATSDNRESTPRWAALRWIRMRAVIAGVGAGCAMVLLGCSHGATGSGSSASSSSSSGSGNKFSFERKYTVGNKDVYSIAMDQGTQMNSTMTDTQLVTKTYEDGSADITSTISDMKMKMNGKDMTVPAAAMTSTTMRTDKFGRPTIDSVLKSDAVLPCGHRRA